MLGTQKRGGGQATAAPSVQAGGRRERAAKPPLRPERRYCLFTPNAPTIFPAVLYSE